MGMTQSGRDLSGLELVGGTRATFAGPDSVADVERGMADIPGADRARVHDVLHEAAASTRTIPGRSETSAFA